MKFFECSQCNEHDVDLSAMCRFQGCPKEHEPYTETRFVMPVNPDVSVLHLEIPAKLLDDYETAFGYEAVYLHNIEEAAEYIHAITKFLRYMPKVLAGVHDIDHMHELKAHVVEEAADLQICVMHLMRLLKTEDALVAKFAEKQGKAVRNITKQYEG